MSSSYRASFPTRRSPSVSRGLAGRRRDSLRRPSRAIGIASPSLTVESLEPRALLAVTATLVGGDLEIAFNADGDLVADISSDGTKYTVTGTGLASTLFNVADVTGIISVADKAAVPGQSFTVSAGVAIDNAIQVNANVESTAINGGITAAAAGDVLIGSAAISLANNVSTAATNAKIEFAGAVTLAKNTIISAGTGAIAFKSTVDGGFALTANTSGTTTFGNAVGGDEALVSLTTDSGGTSNLLSVTTTGAQSYGDNTTTLNGTYTTSNASFTVANAANLAGNSLVTTGNGAINFAGTVNGGSALTANTSGTTTFGGAVGGTTPLASLTTDSGGTSSLKSVTTTGAQTYNDDTVTLNGTYTTTDSNFTVDKVTTLAGNTAVNTGAGAGNITFSGTLNGTTAGAQDLALTAGTGNVTFTGAVGGGTRLGAISIASATNVTANAITAASLSQAAGSGTTTLNGAVDMNTAAGVSLTGTNLAVNAGVTTTNNGVVTFSESGTIKIATAGNILADGAVSMTATDGITTAGNVTTTNDDVTFASATTLSGAVAADTGTGAGNILFSKSLDGTKTGTENLTLTAGTGNVTFGGAVGGGTRLGAVSITSATDVTAAAMTAASLSQAAGSGTTTLNGAVNTNTAAGVSLTGTNLAVNAGVTTTSDGVVTFNESGTITIAAAGHILADGAVSMTAKDGITTAGDVTTTNDDVTFASATTLSGAVAANTGKGAGNILFSKTLDGARPLALTAGTGTVTFSGAVGGTTPLAGISLASATSVTASSTITLDGTPGLATDGIAIAAGVNNVSFVQSGSEIRDFSGSGVVFQGGSTNSQLAGFTVTLNGANGLRFASGDYTGTVLTSNAIRDNGNTTTHVGNGILVEGSNLMIGWTATAGETNLIGNTITGNALNGIEIRGAGAQNNTILSNSIFLNGYVDTTGPAGKTVVGEGIALSDGGNGGQVAPTILRMVDDATDGVIRVQFIVPAAGSYYVQFFDNTPADERAIFPVDANGFEGRTFIGDHPAQTGSTVTTVKPPITGTVVTGNTRAVVEIPANRIVSGNWITATATLVDGTTATNTSPFSAAFQRLDAPVLGVGGDGSSAIWDREFAYTATSATKIQIGGLSAAQAGFFAPATRITAASVGIDSNVSTTVAAASYNARSGRLTITLRDPVPVGSGTLVLGSPSLPSARLLDASDRSELTVSESVAIKTALAAVPGLTPNQVAAFVTRFQGGLRVASADFDGDGFIDLVTAPGGVPARLQPSLRNVFGSAARVITIYNGNPAGTWDSVSIDVSAQFGAGYLDGFLVAAGNSATENPGSGSSTVELVVASTNKVAVFDVTVSARGGQPVIASIPTRAQTVAGTVTGLATGTFSGPVTGLADVVVAATSKSAKTRPTDSTTTISVLQPGGGVSSFKVNSQVLDAEPAKGGKPVNVFLNGASLAAGDIDNLPDQKPELILGAGAGGLGNFRVLSADLVANANQATIDAVLKAGGQFPQPARGVNSVTGRWQPSGGPDYFAGVANVPTPLGSGLNAPLSVAVVESNGKDFKAEVYAALGATNQTPNQLRALVWSGVNWSGTDAHTVDGRTRFRNGTGLRLG